MFQTTLDRGMANHKDFCIYKLILNLSIISLTIVLLTGGGRNCHPNAPLDPFSETVTLILERLIMVTKLLE
jgi:hypothetical protein